MEKVGMKSTAKLTYSERTSLSSFPRTLPTLSVRHPVILGVFTGFISKAHKPTVSSSGYAPQPLQPGDDSRIQDRLRLFDEIFHNFSMNYRKEYMLYSCLCLYQFLGSFTFLKPYRNITSTMGSPSFAHRVIRFMHENVQNNLTLSQLAAQFKYSPSHFSDMFRQEIGGSSHSLFHSTKDAESLPNC